MINRQIINVIKEASTQFPVLTLTGPRQSGKTTVCKHIFNNYLYYSLEDPDVRQRAKEDPRSFLSNALNGIILDEIQQCPELLSYIQGIVDNSSEYGKIILTGSNQFSLMDSVTQTLAGRTAIIKLLPCTLHELRAFGVEQSTDRWLLAGSFPGVYYHKQNIQIAYRSYYETYVERDRYKIIQTKKSDKFNKFLRLCAKNVGQLFNANALANETGVSANTIQSWLSVLKTSFIVFTLEPFYENISKRVIKMPKLYFYDTGLLSYLLGIETENQMSRDPLRGSIFENMVITDVLKQRYNKALSENLFFYRDSNGNEIDLMIKSGTKYDIIEIKSSETFNNEHLKGIKYALKTFPQQVNKQFVVYSGAETLTVNDCVITPYGCGFVE